MPKNCYSEAVDAHIYTGLAVGCHTQQEWIQLAIAALDQAGLSVADQKEVEALLQSKEYSN